MIVPRITAKSIEDFTQRVKNGDLELARAIIRIILKNLKCFMIFNIQSFGLMSNSRLVLTDSGGLQEETTALGIPCITLRENTERPITVTEGTNTIVGCNPELIVKTAFEALDGKGKTGRIPALWDGKTSERIADVILQFIENGD